MKFQYFIVLFLVFSCKKKHTPPPKKFKSFKRQKQIITPEVNINNKEGVVESFVVYEKGEPVAVSYIEKKELKDQQTTQENSKSEEENDNKEEIIGGSVAAGAITLIGYRVFLIKKRLKNEKKTQKGLVDSITKITKTLDKKKYTFSLPSQYELLDENTGKPYFARAEQSYIFKIKEKNTGKVHILKLLKKIDKPNFYSWFQWFLGLKDTPKEDEKGSIRSQEKIFTDKSRFTDIRIEGDNYVIKNYIDGTTLKNAINTTDWSFKDPKMEEDFELFMKEMLEEKNGKFRVLEDLNAGNLIFDKETKKWVVIDSKPYKEFKDQQKAIDYAFDRLRDKLRSRWNPKQHGGIRKLIGKDEGKTSSPQEGGKYAFDDRNKTLDRKIDAMKQNVQSKLKLQIPSSFRLSQENICENKDKVLESCCEKKEITLWSDFCKFYIEKKESK